MLGERRSRTMFPEWYTDSLPDGNLKPALSEPDLERMASAEKKKEDGKHPGLDHGGREKGEESFQMLEMISEQDQTADETDHSSVHGAYARNARPLRTQDLFFAAGNGNRDFASVLREIQEYLAKEYSSLITEDGSEETKAQIRRFAGKYIQDHRIAVDGMTTDELIDGIYSEMAEFGFLTKYIYGEGIEEIDGATRS